MATGAIPFAGAAPVGASLFWSAAADVAVGEILWRALNLIPQVRPTNERGDYCAR